MSFNTTIIFLAIRSSLCNSPLLTSGAPRTIVNSRLSKAFSSFIHTSQSIRAYELSVYSTLRASVILDSTSIYSTTYKTQYFPAAACSFYWCIFNNSAATGSTGSAVYSSSGYTLYFYGCEFLNCYTNYYPSAAAIYSTGNITARSCCFDRCYNGVPTDNYFTNVMYCTGSGLTLLSSLFFRSAESNSAGADSTFYTYAGQVSIANINCTSCFGSYGGAGGRIDNPLAGSSYIYSQVTRCGQYASMDLITCNNANISFYNIFNNSQFQGGLLCVNAGIAKMDHIICWKNTCTSYVIICNSGVAVMTNCVGDFSDASFTFSASPAQNGLSIIFASGCAFSATGRFTFEEKSVYLRQFSVYMLLSLFMD